MTESEEREIVEFGRVGQAWLWGGGRGTVVSPPSKEHCPCNLKTEKVLPEVSPTENVLKNDGHICIVHAIGVNKMYRGQGRYKQKRQEPCCLSSKSWQNRNLTGSMW